jgi:amino acid transporter
MDMILVSTFVIGALVIIYNVILKRVEASPRKERIQRWDRRLVWLYPAVYVAGFALVTWLFLFSGIPIN